MKAIPLIFSSKGIAALTAICIAMHLILLLFSSTAQQVPLFVAIFIGGSSIIFNLIKRIFQGSFGADILAGLSIVGCFALGEYLAATVVVLMLSGGEALEQFAVRTASRALQALAQRMPIYAHKVNSSEVIDVLVDQISVGDRILIYPHETFPVDGEILDGHSSADESYLTGEPYQVAKGPGSSVISGSINGNGRLTMIAKKRAHDSRYTQIARVMEESRQKRPQLRRIGDMLGALYTPVVVLIALLVYFLSGEIRRSLAVIVVATPCPLLIAIPVAIIGAISLAAKRSIIVKDPTALERAPHCTRMIFDKTGTLTIGEPVLTEIIPADSNFSEDDLLQYVASLERYSKHPLAQALLNAANNRGLRFIEVSEVHEAPGKGLIGSVGTRRVVVTGRKSLAAELQERLPSVVAGLECVIIIDDLYAGLIRFRDQPRADSRSFIAHLEQVHHFQPSMLLSGDRAAEVSALAAAVGITETHASKSPEEKVQIIAQETKRGGTIYVGDGINDAPALLTATVGIAFGPGSDITAEAAAVVVLEPKLKKIDEFLHISKRMRRIALESAIGGMAFSFVGVIAASFGYITPLNAALLQEGIDILAVMNALRAAYLPSKILDYQEP